MPPSKLYDPTYTRSRALIVGIDKYQNTSPLLFASNDATAISDVLKSQFGFKEDDVTVLIDKEATRSAITHAFLSFASQPDVDENDRIVFFFAGHGHTISGRTGEIGFLVPVDGDATDLSSLIRWDELTRNADLIPANHILFIVDACYGGLALKRKPPPAGSMRFLHDMVQRYARQVLTAGKADEVVSDSDGSRPGHSIFTSAVLDALEGQAASAEGVLSATSMMAYVYKEVGENPLSRQTPHYGFTDGDGDLIFLPELLPAVATAGSAGLHGRDALYSVVPTEARDEESSLSAETRLKRLLSDPKLRISLDECVNEALRGAVGRLSSADFSTATPATDKEFIERVKRYEYALGDLIVFGPLLGRWADEVQRAEIEKILSRLCEAEKGDQGYQVWIRLGWYPVMFLMYLTGIAALSGNQWRNLHSVLYATVQIRSNLSGQPTSYVLESTVDQVKHLNEWFKKLPSHERNYVPRSEYLFKSLQPHLEDAFYLGKSYENLFDRFEIILALSYAYERQKSKRSAWAPPGRFAWKFSSYHPDDPFSQLVKEAQAQGSTWPPVVSGLFGGSIESFLAVATEYQKFMGELGFH